MCACMTSGRTVLASFMRAAALRAVMAMPPDSGIVATRTPWSPQQLVVGPTGADEGDVVAGVGLGTRQVDRDMDMPIAANPVLEQVHDSHAGHPLKESESGRRAGGRAAAALHRMLESSDAVGGLDSRQQG